MTEVLAHTLERYEPSLAPSAALAFAVHVLLFAVLVFGVRWQNRPPDVVNVELWEEPRPAALVEVPKPLPKVEPAPVVKSEPAIEKPDIAVKREPPKPKPLAKPEPPKANVAEEQKRKRMHEEAAREQVSLAVDREREQIREQQARDAASASSKALAAWVDKVRLLIRSRIRIEIAQAVPDKAEAVFMVRLLPSYEVLTISMMKSSGNRAYDEEVERAITFFKTTPLPKPERPDLINRELRLTFRPRD